MSRRTKQLQTNSSLLGKGVSIDMNSLSIQSILMYSSSYIIRRIIITNASTSLTTAVGLLYSDSGATAAIITSTVLSALTAPGKYKDCVLAGGATTDIMTTLNLYLKLSVAQGSAATADIYVYGDNLN